MLKICSGGLAASSGGSSGNQNGSVVSVRFAIIPLYEAAAELYSRGKLRIGHRRGPERHPKGTGYQRKHLSGENGSG